MDFPEFDPSKPDETDYQLQQAPVVAMAMAAKKKLRPRRLRLAVSLGCGITRMHEGTGSNETVSRWLFPVFFPTSASGQRGLVDMLIPAFGCDLGGVLVATYFLNSRCKSAPVIAAR